MVRGASKGGLNEPEQSRSDTASILNVRNVIRMGSLLTAFLPALATMAQAPTPSKRSMICEEGANQIEFLFDGKGGAILTRIKGPEIRHFRDLHERDWTVRVVREDGVMKIHVANARGALLSVLAAPETSGRLTWNDPPGAKADYLCKIMKVS